MLSQNDIIYFVLTDRFYDGDQKNNFDVDKSNPFAYHGGDFAGIIKKIPYLKNLGITALWITPVYINIHMADKKFYGYHGYWPLDFEKIDPHLYTEKPGREPGSKAYLKDLADELHRHNIKLVLDMVVNHTGYNHPGLVNDPSSKIKADWFNEANLSFEQSEEHGRMMGLPDLDQDHPEVADYFANVILDWIEDTGIDCIRMDTVKNVERVFWQRFKTVVKGKHPNVSLLGEVLENDVDRLAEFQKYFAFDSLFDFPLQSVINDIFIYGASLNILASSGLSGAQGLIDKDSHYTNHNRLVTLLDNHDLPARFITKAMQACGGDKKKAAEMLKLAMTFMMTTRGIPQIYYGTEIALEGGADPDNRRDMPWEIFKDDEPLEQYSIERDVFLHTKNLIKLRKENESLQFGTLTTLYADNFIYAYLREFRGNAIITVINNGSASMPVPLDISIEYNANIPPRVINLFKGKKLINFIDTHSPLIPVKNGRFSVSLAGKTAAVYGIAWE